MKDPKLYEEIMSIVSRIPDGIDLHFCANMLKMMGFDTVDESIAYKALHILLRSNLLERRYSFERKRVVYLLPAPVNLV